MKSINALLLIVMMVVTSCSKTIEETKEDLVMTAMTSGTWYVQEFQENGVVVTPIFSGFDFKFNTNGTVDGVKASLKTTGTWSGDASAMTITSNFPVASDTLLKFNAVWKITNNSWDYVKATTSVGGTTRYLHLKKR
jgi:hypothetical protein